MKLSEIITVLKAKMDAGDQAMDREIRVGAATDLMSEMLRGATHGVVLVTGLNNIQVIRTSVIAGVAAVILVREKAMPGPEESGDAMHVAVATVHRMDVMLSWNVRHLANRNKTAHLREVCRRVGYLPPEIVTPDAFWETEDE